MRTELWKHAVRKATVRLACIAALIATASLVSGQPAATAAAGNVPEPTQAVQHDYRFEVASIRLAPDQTGRRIGPSGPSYTPGHYRSETETIVSLAFKAYGTKHGYELKYPEWMLTTHFTINATIPEGATKDDLPVMIRHLLEDRFDLKAHHEAKLMDGYELVVAKSGPKLTRSEGPLPNSSGPAKAFKFPEIKDGVPQFGKDSGPAQMYTGSAAGLVAWWHGRDESMQRFASDLSGRLRVPVTDATGLDGKYDFSLNFIEENSSISAGSNGAATPSEYSPLPNALEQQLGLKLKPIKNVPIDVVVLDSANKQPTEN